MPGDDLTHLTPKKGVFDEAGQVKFLAALRKWGNVSEACKAARISRPTAYEHRVSNLEFAEQWDDALEEACDSLEKEAVRRARDGVIQKKGVYFEGALIGTEVKTEYSDTLMIFLLKAHRPKKYREPVQRFASTDSDGNDKPELTDEERAARTLTILDRARARRDGQPDSPHQDVGTPPGASE